ncbi:tetranectin-like [Carassius carassius]|uniref:tetranectin-like n=1 Tax=Carassius carassius TaxID=217509 RepID=UPI00286843B6|nr:tetranectin-like [Carassius carassius]
MRLRDCCLLLGVLLLLTHTSHQQNNPRKKPNAKKDTQASAALEDLQKQIKDIVVELNLLKEQQALQTVCLRGTKIPGKCFLVDSVKKGYHTASEDCIAKGGILSTPLSSDENAQLYDYVRQSIGPDAEIWLGINDMQTEGVWLDQAGSNIRYKNWKLPQPDGSSAENCAVLSGASGGKWLDEKCREERASVCEFNIV